VARDELGVLSSCLACLESARTRGLSIAALVLVAQAPAHFDPSTATNQHILSQLARCPVLRFPHCGDDSDDTLRDAAVDSGLLALAQQTLATRTPPAP
jgi:hypothetical protein